MIAVERAPAYLTVQDLGRRGHLADGVPRCGAMDGWTLAALNEMLGNSRDAAGLEWALSGGELVFTKPMTVVLGGADAECEMDGATVQPYRALDAQPGDRLTVERIVDGRFLYIAVAGGIQCERVLGSRSTYLAGGFGGIGGRRLARGDTILVHEHRSQQRRQMHCLPENLRPPRRVPHIRVIMRTDTARESICGNEYRVSAASDRTGYRLDGAVVGGASITSEPVCPGAIQLPPGGLPIVLMADAPTIGGYAIAGAVISADLGALAQLAPGEAVRFKAVSVIEAQSALRRCEKDLLAIRAWSV